MNRLKKLWFCDHCRNLVVGEWEGVPTACPYCKKNQFTLIRPAFGTMEDAFVPVEQLVIKDKTYILKQLIGKGGFGSVYIVQESGDGEYFALKIPNSFQNVVMAVEKNKSLGETTQRELANQNRSIRQEVNAFFHYSLPAMMPIVEWGVFYFDKYEIQFFIQELGYVSLFQLYDRLNSEQKKLNPELRYALGYEMVRAVAEAHQKKILLQDLSMENLVVQIDHSNQLRLRLIDFGGAKTETISHSINVYRYQYLPTKYQVTTKDLRRDVFNLGVLLFEILTGVPSWTRLGEANILADRGMMENVLNNFENFMLSKYVQHISDIPEYEKILEVLKRAVTVNEKLIFPDATYMLEDLPPSDWEFKRELKNKTVEVEFVLTSEDDKTRKAVNIDKYVDKEGPIRLTNAGAFRSSRYLIHLPFNSSYLRVVENQAVYFDFDKANLQHLTNLNARLKFTFDILLEEK